MARLRALLGVSRPGCALVHALVLRRLREHPSFPPAGIQAEDPPGSVPGKFCTGEHTPRQPRGSALLKAREAFLALGWGRAFWGRPQPHQEDGCRCFFNPGKLP